VSARPAITRVAALVAVLAAVLPACGCAAPSAGPGTAPGTGGPDGSPSPGFAFSSEPPAAMATLPDPRKRMLLGTYISLSSLPGVSGQPGPEAAIEQREAAMGRTYDLQLTYYNWGDAFPDSGEATIAAHGRIPMMAWYGPGKDSSDPHTLGEVTDGSQDALITRQAEAIKAFGHPVWLRLMPEMNGNWYHGYSGHPAQFVAAWRRIHNLFEAAGASNVVWVWCPNVGPVNWDPYYPGNAYVDVIGVDGFSNTRYGYQTFEHLFGNFFSHFAGRKPLMVVETATDSGNGNPSLGIGSAASFISGMSSYLRAVAGPRYGVVAMCWFDADTTDGYNWRVDQTPASWRAWLAMAREPYFGGRLATLSKVKTFPCLIGAMFSC
jgi:hypothetical protein